MNGLWKRALCSSLALLPLVASNASAQKSFGVSFRNHSQRSSIGLGYESGRGFFGYGQVHRPLRQNRYTKVSQHVCQPVRQKVWVAGRHRSVWVDPVYKTLYQPCGTPYRVLVRNGYWKKIWQPGYYETRLVNTCCQSY